MDTQSKRDNKMEANRFVGKSVPLCPLPGTHSSLLAPRRAAFTLVELLVVITIIGILASLITVAAIGALKAMQRTRIKAEITEVSNGFDEYKNKVTAYPPNCQTDGTGTGNPLVEADVLNDLKRHIKQVATRSAESDDLARVLTGQTASVTASYPNVLEGGLTAAEAIPFWLGGFSSDPKFPISGDGGGPSYRIDNLTGGVTPAQADPIESRKWIYPFDITRLGPRDSNGYFNGRFIEYTDPKNQNQRRRINFWTYTPAKSDQPLLYFDTSRHPVGTARSSQLTGVYDPPAATLDTSNPNLAKVFAFKKVVETAGPVATTPQIQWINPDRFQVIHCGIDNAWDTDTFQKMAAPRSAGSNDPADYLLFPGGPFIGEMADTIVNFTTETTIEDAQK